MRGAIIFVLCYMILFLMGAIIEQHMQTYRSIKGYREQLQEVAKNPKDQAVIRKVKFGLTGFPEQK